MSILVLYISNMTVVQLVYEKLPNDISERHVLLLDPILGTGSLTFLSCFPPKNTLTFLQFLLNFCNLKCVRKLSSSSYQSPYKQRCT